MTLSFANSVDTRLCGWLTCWHGFHSKLPKIPTLFPRSKHSYCDHEMRFRCLTLVLTYIGRLDFMLCCFFSTVRLRFIPSYRIHFSSMPPLCVISYCLLDWFTVVFYFGGFQHWAPSDWSIPPCFMHWSLIQFRALRKSHSQSGWACVAVWTSHCEVLELFDTF